MLEFHFVDIQQQQQDYWQNLWIKNIDEHKNHINLIKRNTQTKKKGKEKQKEVKWKRKKNFLPTKRERKRERVTSVERFWWYTTTLAS